MKRATQKESMEELKYKKNKTSLKKAKADIKRFRETYPNQTDFINVSKANLLKFLDNPDVIALRMYFARNEKNENTMVFVGVDKDGENILLKPKSAKDKVAASTTSKTAARTQNDTGESDDSYDDSLLNDFQTCPPPIPPNNNL